jgi:tetratricopeptide (TPR) repeat protein
VQAASYVEKGITAQDGGDSDRADQYLSLATTLASPRGEGALQVAQWLLQERRTSKAALLLQEAVANPPLSENPLAFGLLAHLYDLLSDSKSQKQNREHAEELVRQALDLVDKAVPSDENARQARVWQLLRAGQYCQEFSGDAKQSVRLLRGAVRQSTGDSELLLPVDAQALSRLGLALALHPELAEDKGETTRFTRLAARYDTGDGDLLHTYGVVQLLHKDYMGARRVLGQVVELDPENTAAHAQLGEALLRLRAYREAAVELDRALVREPENRRARQLRASLPNPLPAPEVDPEEEL